MSYQATIRYLESFINFEKIAEYPYKESLKLERVKDFLLKIGNPQETLQCIHVAGSKGKGSTCAFCAYILKEAGYKVGLYTSPHLSDFRERIRILGGKATGPADFEGMISRQDLARLVKKLKPAIEKYNKASKYGPLSFFEVYTALAFVYFKEKKVDLVVLETGLGGRLDATNTVYALVSVITPISYEHTQKLGNTLQKIATEKSGIIKGGHVISAPQKKEALDVIRKRCKETKAKLEVVARQNLKASLIGEHQLMNASVATAAIRALRQYNIKVSQQAIQQGLKHTVWPSRCEVIAQRPTVILDGAQNAASAAVLKKAVRGNFKFKHLILVLGVSNDKDIAGICRALKSLADKVILTRSNNPRAIDPGSLAFGFRGKETYLTESVLEAKQLAKKLAAAQDLILVTGSLFVTGEFRNG